MMRNKNKTSSKLKILSLRYDQGMGRFYELPYMSLLRPVSENLRQRLIRGLLGHCKGGGVSDMKRRAVTGSSRGLKLERDIGGIVVNPGPSQTTSPPSLPCQKEQRLFLPAAVLWHERPGPLLHREQPLLPSMIRNRLSSRPGKLITTLNLREDIRPIRMARLTN